MRRGLWIAVVTAIAIAAGCQKSAGHKPAQGSAAAPVGSGGSAVPPAPIPLIPSNAALSRPASVTDDEVKTADAYVAATEALAKDVSAAGTDCKKAAAAIQANVPKLGSVVAAVDKLRAEANADPEAKRWFQTNYMPKIMAAAGTMNATTQACKDDADFVAAAKSMPMGQAPPPPGPAVVPAPSTTP